jgi:hypothetical protein
MAGRSEGGTDLVSIRVAVRRTGLAEEVVQDCLRRRVVAEPLTERDLVELRRVRRLRALGVNMPGIEIILHMRRRMQALQTAIAGQEPNWPASRSEEWILTEERWQRLLPPTPDR